MKSILILAEGLKSEYFIERINQNRIGDNHYTIVAPRELAMPEKLVADIELKHFDPTSLSKLKNLFLNKPYSMVFIVLRSLEESRESLKNIRLIDEKIKVHIVDRWDAFGRLHESSTHIINLSQIAGNRLFDDLPNVPVVAQNIGLREGEIMEVLVSLGSSFAYRHVGSIAQVKWKIAALYRDNQLLLPTSATMIRPQDTLLIVGKPKVLNSIYHRINKREGFFPEPFGKHLYLLLNMEEDEAQALNYLRESLYLHEHLEQKRLIIRILNPGNIVLLEKIKSHRSEMVDILITYGDEDIMPIITSDMQKNDIGLLFSSMEVFACNTMIKELYHLRKLVYLFGDSPLYNIYRSVVLVTEEEEMESISSSSFYISEALNLDMSLCYFDPEGEFHKKSMIIEHYETLSHAVGYPLNVETKSVNPVRELSIMENVLQITPFSEALERSSIFSFFSTESNDHLLGSSKHPKLLIPVILT